MQVAKLAMIILKAPQMVEPANPFLVKSESTQQLEANVKSVEIT